MSQLLGILSADHPATHPLRGNIFENYMVIEALKSRYNCGRPDNVNFFRDAKGREVDLVFEEGNALAAWVFKVSATFHQDFLKGVDYLSGILPVSTAKALILGNRDTPYRFRDCSVYGYDRIVEVAAPT